MTPADEKNARSDEVVVEYDMDASPEKLWRALTDEELAADWLGARPEGENREEGPSYRIVEAEAFNRVRYVWRDPDFPDAPPTVTVELEPLSSGHTRLRLTHGDAAAGVRRRPSANDNRPLLTSAA